MTRATAWITRHTAAAATLVGIEGTSSYGATFTHHLIEAGFEVCEVKPPRKAARGNAGKTDAIDALTGAISLLRVDTNKLIRPRGGQVETELIAELLAEREMLTTQRTQRINHLIAYARTRDLGIDARRGLTLREITEIAEWADGGDPAKNIAIRQAAAILAISAEIDTCAKQLRRCVESTAPQILDEFGVGPVVAGRLIVAYGKPGRIRSEAAFASLAGVSPVPASSGNTVRYRLNRMGDRKLNAALHTVAMAREQRDPTTREYVARRTAEGKTRREIRRCLKRAIARQLYRRLDAIMTTEIEPINAL